MAADLRSWIPDCLRAAAPQPICGPSEDNPAACWRLCLDAPVAGDSVCLGSGFPVVFRPRSAVASPVRSPARRPAAVFSDFLSV